MLFCPVIWPNDTAICYPFNRTLFDPSQPVALKKSVAAYLGVGTTAAIVTRPVRCAIDYPTGLSIIHSPVPQGVYLMWARPLTRADAERDDLFATNDLASDLIQFGNRTQSDWCSRVEAARSGRQGVFVDTVVTGPAILFYRNPRDGIHASVDIDLIIRNKMGNAGSWFGVGPECGLEVLSPLSVVSGGGGGGGAAAENAIHDRVSNVADKLPYMNVLPSLSAKDALESPVPASTTTTVISTIVRVKEAPLLGVAESQEKAGREPHEKRGSEPDDADDPLASHEIRPLMAVDTVLHSHVNETAPFEPIASLPKEEETPPESSPKRRKRTPITAADVVPTEKTFYQTRRRSGIHKVNPRYAK